MITKLKLLLSIGGLIGALVAGYYIKLIFDKAQERDEYAKQNKELVKEKKTLADSLRLHKEWLAKSLIDTKNSFELYEVTKGMTASFQSVIAIMRDSVIKINKDRVKLQSQVLELQKDLEAARKKKKGLF